MTRFAQLICVLATIIGLSYEVVESSGRGVVGPVAGQNGAVLNKLREPVYPPLARQTRIIGDVHLMLKVRSDGSVESATVVSGHPLLQQAALDSAQKSQFECRKCDETDSSLELVYTFQLVGAERCCTSTENDPKNDQPIPRVIQSQNRVTVVDRVACICDPSADVTKVRSLKCLYLWKCKSLYPL